MKSLPGLILIVAGGLLLASGAQAMGQIGNFTAPLGQPSFNGYAAPFGAMGQPTPSAYGAPYGQLGLPSQSGQLLPGYPSNFARPPGAPTPFGQPTFAQPYFGIANYAQPMTGLPGTVPSYNPAAAPSVYSRAYIPTAPLGFNTNFTTPAPQPFSTPLTGGISGRNPLLPH